MSADLSLLLNATYVDRTGASLYVSIDATLEQALSVFRSFQGDAASLYLVTSDHSLAAWHKHGPRMYDVQLVDHVLCRKRSAQVANDYAEDCLRRVYGGDMSLSDIESAAYLYVAGAWDPRADPMYWSARSRDWPKKVEPPLTLP
jgi:hypothetical protein